MSATGTEPATRAGTAPSPQATGPTRRASARDLAGRKREYETIYILRPDSTTDVISQVNLKVRGVIEAGGGTLLKVDNWGKRKLAYEVKKQLKGIYLFSLPRHRRVGRRGRAQPAPPRLRHPLLLGEDRENVDPAVRVTELTEESFTQASTPGPDEEAIATGQAEVRSPFDDDEGAFDFEEAVFGGVDEPGRGRGMANHGNRDG